jgi:replicative DNA helicase
MAENNQAPRKNTKNGIRGNALMQALQQAGAKIPPHAIELEKAVLGAMMLERDSLNLVIERLKPETFYLETHQLIFTAIYDLFKKSEKVDILTVVNQLKKNGHFELIGGASYLTSLTQYVHSAAHLESHVSILIEYAIKRELIELSFRVQRDAYEDKTDAFELLNSAEQEIFQISESSVKRKFQSIKDVIRQAIDELEEKKGNTEGITGIPSGFTALDRVTAGWQRSDLIILAARPGMGKTAFVLSMMRNAAVMFDKSVAIFSLEMANTQLVNRLLAAEAEIDSEKLKKGKLEPYEWELLLMKSEILMEKKIIIDDTPSLSIVELRSKCRKIKASQGLDLVIIDYLQLMSGDVGKNGNREQEISMISRSLKNLAKELNVPVIALAQLNRQVESRGSASGGKRPQLSDLRESGSIEQDADMVVFLYREEYYRKDGDESPLSKPPGTVEVIIAKHRNGELTTVDLKFIPRFIKFADPDERYDLGTPSFNFNNNDSALTTVKKSSKLNEALSSNKADDSLFDSDTAVVPF